MAHIRITCPWNPSDAEEEALSRLIGRASQQGVRIKKVYELERDAGKYKFERVGRILVEVNARLVAMFHEELRK